MLKNTFIIILQWILSLRYRVSLSQTQKIQKQSKSGVLFLANHPALIDPLIVVASLFRKYRVRPLADEAQMNRPVLKHLFRLVNPILIPDVEKDGRNARHRATAAIQNVMDALKNGDNILLYPSGRIYRSETELIGANSAVETIIKHVPDVNIVLVRTTGLWGSAFSHASGKAPKLRHVLPQRFVSLLLSAIFFLPRRNVHLHIAPQPAFPKTAPRLEMNRFMEAYFNADIRPAVRIPYSIFGSVRQVDSVVDSPLSKTDRSNGEGAHISDKIKIRVRSYLGKTLQVSAFSDSASLSQDLGMDSIAKMALATWIETRFRMSPINVEQLETVEDCYLAAGGALEHTDADAPAFPDNAWRRAMSKSLTTQDELKIHDGSTIAALFLAQAKAHPNRVIVADPLRGSLTYRKVLASIFALKPHIEKLPGQTVGMMLPASTAAAVTYLACMFAGKTPVLFNFTAGRRAVSHGVRTTDVRAILTSALLQTKLRARGEDYTDVGAALLNLEDIGKRISSLDKVKALLKTYVSIRTLKNAPVSDVAAVLFTSGSESFPKAVPLTHSNIIANLRAFSGNLHLLQSDSMLAILPPFHSFGLTGNLVMPLCMGLRTVYYPNPTESGELARLITDAKTSCLLATPTFLSGILNQSDGLDSLRLTFVGAEKCPSAVYEAYAIKCPNGVLCEGYGITECSPVISMNPVVNPILETIGRVLPNMGYAIVDEAMQQRVAKGEAGTLLVRGDNVFGGYFGDEAPSPFVIFENHQWYNTGDMVSERRDGTLDFRGRKKRFIKIGGEMISLPAIEDALKSVAPFNTGGGECAVVPMTENDTQLALYTSVATEPQWVNQTLRERGFSPLHRISKVVVLQELPKLGSGKINYRALAEMGKVAA